MDFLPRLQNFTKVDMQQGKWMIGVAIIFLLSLGFLLFKNNLYFQKGMAFPVCLLFVINAVYGSYVLHSKPKHLEETEQQFQSNPKQTFYFELQKVKADDKSYNILKYVWVLVLSFLLHFTSFYQKILVKVYSSALSYFFLDSY